MQTKVVTIVGGGASGTLLAVQLLRQNHPDLGIKLVEPSNEVGRGVAYQRSKVDWLLNVPVGRMSAFPDEPEHFSEWLQARKTVGARKQFQPADFVSREVYGDYLQDILTGARAQACGDRLEIIRDKAAQVTWWGEGGVIRTQGGVEWSTDYLVLAIGNFPPQHPLGTLPTSLGSKCYLANPWLGEWPDFRILKEPKILILGTGLTAIDTVFRLQREGYPEKILLLSRRGFLPHRHATVAPLANIASYLAEPCSLRRCLRVVRQAVAEATQRDLDWRSVMDAVRPFSAKLWQGFSEGEKRRFLTHLRPYWEVHRHRLAPELAEQIDHWRESGQVEVLAGRLRSAEEFEGKVRVVIQLRKNQAEQEFHVGAVINCLGPEANFRRFVDPFVSKMIQDGLIRPNKLGLGLEAEPDGRLLNSAGVIHEKIFALGPPLKGVLWESTALPEIRLQAKLLAQRISGIKKC